MLWHNNYVTFCFDLPFDCYPRPIFNGNINIQAADICSPSLTFADIYSARRTGTSQTRWTRRRQLTRRRRYTRPVSNEIGSRFITRVSRGMVGVTVYWTRQLLRWYCPGHGCNGEARFREYLDLRAGYLVRYHSLSYVTRPRFGMPERSASLHHCIVGVNSLRIDSSHRR